MKIPDSAIEIIRDNGMDISIYSLQNGKFALCIRERQYRHADLDQLVAIALADEKEDELRKAIREAIYAAQDEIGAKA
jgi:hypothetical protein